MRAVTASNSASREHYPTTLFPQQEAYAGSCTSKSTVYCANIAAGLMVSQYAKWLRWLRLEPDLLLALLSNELTAEELATVG